MALDWTHGVALILGLLIGGLAVWAGLRRSGGGKQARETEQAFQDYRDRVAKHFAETSRLVNDLTDRYQTVFEQLQDGAGELVDPDTLSELVGEQDGRTITIRRLGHRPAAEPEAPPSDSAEAADANGESPESPAPTGEDDVSDPGATADADPAGGEDEPDEPGDEPDHKPDQKPDLPGDSPVKP